MTEEGELIPDAEDQLRQAFINTEKNLIAAGATQGWKAVYKCVAYHGPDLDEGRLSIYGKLIKEFCGSNRPSQVSIAVPYLWKDAHIEITVEAVLI